MNHNWLLIQWWMEGDEGAIKGALGAFTVAIHSLLNVEPTSYLTFCNHLCNTCSPTSYLGIVTWLRVFTWLNDIVLSQLPYEEFIEYYWIFPLFHSPSSSVWWVKSIQSPKKLRLKNPFAMINPCCFRIGNNIVIVFSVHISLFNFAVSWGEHLQDMYHHGAKHLQVGLSGARVKHQKIGSFHGLSWIQAEYVANVWWSGADWLPTC